MLRRCCGPHHAPTPLSQQRRSLSLESVRGTMEALRGHLRNALSNLRKQHAEGQQRAEEFARLKEENEREFYTGSARGPQQSFRDPFEEGFKRSPLAGDPDHPKNRKRKIEESRRFVESESTKDFPRRVIYGIFAFVSIITIVGNLVQSNFKPPQMKFLPPCEYVDADEDDPMYVENRRRYAEEQRALSEEKEKRLRASYPARANLPPHLR